MNTLAWSSQGLHSGENCSLCFSWLLNQLARASLDFHSGWKLLSRSLLTLKHVCTTFTGLLGRLKPLCKTFYAHKQACTRITGAPQCFLDHSWLLNKDERASQHLGGENGFIRSFWHIHRLERASQGLHRGENCFLGLSSHFNSIARASQDLPGG